MERPGRANIYIYIIIEQMEAMRIVRDNIQPDEDDKIHEYTISCFFSPCECKEMGIWFVGEGMYDRCEEIEYVNKDMLEWQMLSNALTCLCKM